MRSPDQKFIVIRFSDVSVRDLQLNISNVPFSNINTHWLRRMCRELRPQQTQKRRLKFIRNGSILNTHSKIAEELTHYFDTANNSNVATGTSVAPEQNNYYIHCIIGTEELTQAELANEDLKDDATPSNDSMTTQAIGFDRLRSVGFTEQEIELLRQQFRATYGDLEEEEERLAQNGNRDDEGHDIRQLEEQWMESGSGTAQGNGAGGGNEDRFNSVPIANIKHAPALPPQRGRREALLLPVVFLDRNTARDGRIQTRRWPRVLPGLPEMRQRAARGGLAG